MGNKIGGASRRGPHQLELAMKCPRAWRLRKLGMDSAEMPDYRVAGSMIHAGLAHHFAKQARNKPEWYGKQTAKEMMIDACAGQRMDLLPEVEAAVQHVISYGPKFDVVTVEDELTATLGEIAEYNSFLCPPDVSDEEVSCRTDLIEMRSGRLEPVDHKSTKAKLDDRTGDHDLSFQLLMQNLLLRACYDQPVAPMVGVHRVRWSKAVDSRLEFVFLSEEHRAEAFGLMITAVRRELELEKLYGELPTKEWPGFYWACAGRYGPCWALRACKNPGTFDRQLHAIGGEVVINDWL